ncbi:hypothetical protein DMENIID0001_148490 [Sergentomyia squamirostris]
MRLLLVTLFVVFASTNGALPGLGAVTNIANTVGSGLSSLSNIVVINGIIATARTAAAPSLLILNGVDSTTTQKFISDVDVQIANIQEAVRSTNTNPEEINKLGGYIRQIGLLYHDYILAVGPQPGAQPAIQLLATTFVTALQALDTALKASGLPVNQQVFNEILVASLQTNALIAQIPKGV